MTRQPPFHILATALGMFLAPVATGCDDEPADDTASSTDSDGSSSAGNEPIAQCADLQAADDCNMTEFLEDPPTRCVWVEVTPVLDVGTCSLGASVGECIAISTISGGCQETPSCSDPATTENVWVRDSDSEMGVAVADLCQPPTEEGWTSCEAESIANGPDAAPEVCSCLCE